MEFTPFFLQMMARFCGGGGGGPFPSYRAQNGPRGERADLRTRTLKPKYIHRNKKVYKEEGLQQ